MDALIKVLSGTPWWVWVLLVYLTYVSYKISKPRVISLKRPLFLPVILIVLGAIAVVRSGVIFSSVMNTDVVLKWLFVLSGSFLVGCAEGRKMVIQKSADHLQIISQGGWLTPFIIFAIFATKYYLGYSVATNPTEELTLANLLASQFIAGYFLGRVCSLGLKYYQCIVCRQTTT